MAWCRQATSHYLSQCWPRSLSPYSVIRPQWVNHFCGESLRRSVNIDFTDLTTFWVWWIVQSLLLILNMMTIDDVISKFIEMWLLMAWCQIVLGHLVLQSAYMISSSLVQNCIISSASAIEILQFWSNPPKYHPCTLVSLIVKRVWLLTHWIKIPGVLLYVAIDIV